MSIDFDRVIPRRGTASEKWDIPRGEDVLPLWVADMDFRAAPAIVDALRRRAETLTSPAREHLTRLARGESIESIAIDYGSTEEVRHA